LILDWDDTLFPTTFIRQDCGLDWRHKIEKQVQPGPGRDQLLEGLENLSKQVETFLNLAASMAKVVVVTLAKRPWVVTSASNFMPSLKELLDKHKIEVIYAREKLTQEMKSKYSKSTFKSSDQEGDFWSKAKAEAMREQIQLHYAKEGASWKNLLSFGDSDFERIGLISTAEGYVRGEKARAKIIESGLTAELIKSGHRIRLRTKTVKMLDEPALEEMIAQMSLLHAWLPHLVKRDEGIDLELDDSSDDTRLNDLNMEVTGESREQLTWRRLAGLDPWIP